MNHSARLIARLSALALVVQSISQGPAVALEARMNATMAAETSEFSKQYTDLTKKILLSGIALERYSLKYRLEAGKQPKFRTLRYFAAQEAMAGCALGFEAVADKQFSTGRRHPLKVNVNAVRDGFATAMTGSIIGASGSAFELSANFWHDLQSHKHGFGGNDATRFVKAKLKDIDQLIADRSALVEAHKDDPAYARAVAEGNVLAQMRRAFVNEYATFNIDMSGFKGYQNTFYLLNTSYNTIGAISAGLAREGVSNPHLTGPANVLFVVSGALAGASPTLCAVVGKTARWHAREVLKKELGATDFDPQQFQAACAAMRSQSAPADGSLIPALPQAERLALYTESDQRFQKELRNETNRLRHLNKIALGTSFLGPTIGSLLMTQGIFGTYGYYNYGTMRIPRIRKEFNEFYKGAVVGTVGAGINVVGNAAWLLGSLAYEHRLAKQHKLPADLIAERQRHLDEVETLVKAL